MLHGKSCMAMPLAGRALRERCAGSSSAEEAPVCADLYESHNRGMARTRQLNNRRKDAMEIIAKLPHMDDASLTVLHGNAERLLRIGTKKQQASATAVMPAIEAEIAARREAKAAKTKAAAAAKRASAKQSKSNAETHRTDQA
jgi:hypothetical protein